MLLPVTICGPVYVTACVYVYMWDAMSPCIDIRAILVGQHMSPYVYMWDVTCHHISVSLPSTLACYLAN